MSKHPDRFEPYANGSQTMKNISEASKKSGDQNSLSRLLARNARVLSNRGNEFDAHCAYARSISSGIKAEDAEGDRKKAWDSLNRQIRWGIPDINIET